MHREYLMRHEFIHISIIHPFCTKVFNFNYLRNYIKKHFFNLSVLNAFNRKTSRLNSHVFHGKVGFLIVIHESST